MKPKSPEEIKRELFERIQKLKSNEDCYLACNQKKLIPLPQAMPGSLNYLNYIPTFPLCLGGYAGRIQDCPRYRAEIERLEEEFKALSPVQNSKLSIIC